MTYPTADVTIIAHRILEEIHNGEGGTINPRDGLFPQHESGYYIGGQTWTMVVSRQNLNSKLIEFFIDQNWDVVQYEGRYIGWWAHNGRIYLDVSTHVQDKGDAVILGTMFGEIALYDIANKTDLPL